ncbi:hypothetical protein SISSUDRAFT_1067653 [Sistotremastrum suecicum HHB10207 ss-3]|uniref:Uncharacterized protein n=1 Tax=Sistotremastrum suecicum HHB10207 ss-3 TaxID=1314776 RepID=A0A165WVQ2_9AGAM|nr:hypothetical protein SISSUDRAFT_1067653 [Sistotremastrum suecicum HHB10207 ss-3]
MSRNNLWPTNRPDRYGPWKTRQLDNFPERLAAASLTVTDLQDLHFAKAINGMGAIAQDLDFRKSTHTAFIMKKSNRHWQRDITSEMMYDLIAYKAIFEDVGVISFTVTPETFPGIPIKTFAEKNIQYQLPPQFRKIKGVDALAEKFCQDLAKLIMPQIQDFPYRARFSKRTLQDIGLPTPPIRSAVYSNPPIHRGPFIHPSDDPLIRLDALEDEPEERDEEEEDREVSATIAHPVATPVRARSSSPVKNKGKGKAVVEDDEDEEARYWQETEGGPSSQVPGAFPATSLDPPPPQMTPTRGAVMPHSMFTPPPPMPPNPHWSQLGYPSYQVTTTTWTGVDPSWLPPSPLVHRSSPSLSSVSLSDIDPASLPRPVNRRPKSQK